jgi:hypothetical protein
MNDQDKLLDEIRDLEEEFNTLDREVEQLNRDIKEHDELDIDPEDGEESELTRFVEEEEKNKDDTVSKFLVDKDTALFKEGNMRKDNSLTLDMINSTAKKDITNLEFVQDQLTEEHQLYNKASDLLDKAIEIRDASESLKKK